LFLKQGTRIRPQIEGGIQEAGRRGGHENIPAIVGFGRAAELAQGQLPDQMIKLRQLDQQLLRGLATRIPGLSLNGHPSKRLPGHLNLMIRDADSESMVLMLDAKGIAVSIGSACASHASKPSHVLLAIGRTPREAQSSLLITMGASTTETEIKEVKDLLPDLVEQLRHVAGVAV
jgi:cysteine desulfurase